MALYGHVIASYDCNFVGTMKLFVKEQPDGVGDLKHVLACRNQTVNSGYGHLGHCPPGDYYLGAPEPANDPPTAADIPYGHWFTPLLDVYGLWVPYDRSAIGAHGGGSGLANSFAAKQGWQITDGCHRLQNFDNDTIFVPFVKYIRAHALDTPDRAIKFTVINSANS